MKEHEVLSEAGSLACPVYIAESFFSRFRGLMLRRGLREGEGLLLRDCPAIHCFFMRFTIDVIYLDSEMRVLGVETVRPWRIGKHFRGARHVLEIEEGRGSALQPGMKLEFRECEKQ